MVSVMSLRIRPNDDALVMSRVTPSGVVIVHRYSACVWADTMTLIDGSSRLAISAMSLPARLPAQPFRRAPCRVWKPPWWITSTLVLTPFFWSCLTTMLAASASSWNVRPATPAGVTMVGVASRTSPMMPISNFLPLSLLILFVP